MMAGNHVITTDTETIPCVVLVDSWISWTKWMCREMTVDCPCKPSIISWTNWWLVTRWRSKVYRRDGLLDYWITGLLMRSPTLSNNVYMSKIVDTIPLRVRCDPVIRTTVKEDGSDAANCRQVVQSTAKVLDHLDRLDYLDHVDHLEHLEHHIV